MGYMAEKVGFEPTRGLHPCRFSRPVHSTALPLLRAPHSPGTGDSMTTRGPRSAPWRAREGGMDSGCALTLRAPPRGLTTSKRLGPPGIDSHLFAILPISIGARRADGLILITQSIYPGLYWPMLPGMPAVRDSTHPPVRLEALKRHPGPPRVHIRFLPS